MNRWTDEDIVSLCLSFSFPFSFLSFSFPFSPFFWWRRGGGAGPLDPRLRRPIPAIAWGAMAKLVTLNPFSGVGGSNFSLSSAFFLSFPRAGASAPKAPPQDTPVSVYFNLFWGDHVFVFITTQACFMKSFLNTVYFRIVNHLRNGCLYIYTLKKKKKPNDKTKWIPSFKTC